MGNLIKKILKEEILLLEKKIAKIKANLTINYNLRHQEDTEHSQIRKWRHVADKTGERIYDSYIVELVEKAKDDITFNIVAEQITDRVRFIVSQSRSPYLNAVIEPVELNPYEWNLNIITVMNKQDFQIGRNQLQIFV